MSAMVFLKGQYLHYNKRGEIASEAERWMARSGVYCMKRDTRRGMKNDVSTMDVEFL